MSVGNGFKRFLAACAAIVTGTAAYALPPLDTSITYQGRLEDNGNPANGTYDLRFQLADAASLGFLLQTIDVPDVTVVDGIFTADLAFNSSHFNGDMRWLAVGVRPGTSTGAYTSLNPRQELTSAPSAVWATKPWEKTGNNIWYTTGRVGIGNNNPLTDLHVTGGQRLTGGPLIIDGPFAGSSSNAQSIYCQTTGDGLNCWNDSTGDAGVFIARNGDAVRGEILSIAGTPGDAVHGLNNNNDEGAGVRGEGWWGVAGFANAATGYGGVFGGSGGFGSGQALWVLGTSRMQNSLEVLSGTDAEPTGGGYITVGSLTGQNISIDNNEIMARNNGATSTLFLNNDGGIVRVPVLEITGADVAERFPCSEATEPGTVMELDPDNAGQLRISKGSYNKRVAGVVSGAGGLPAGAILGNLPGEEKNPAIAMSGRVWVKCDATNGAIEVGDMLTTSDTAGHAMKVIDFGNAHGCVIGKAMSKLAAGEKGLVLVLVNLQ